MNILIYQPLFLKSKYYYLFIHVYFKIHRKLLLYNNLKLGFKTYKIFLKY